MAISLGRFVGIEGSLIKADPGAGIGWMLWSMAVATPWLIPIHSLPWPMFYPEWVMAAVMLPIAGWTLVRGRSKPWSADALTVAVAAAASVPLLQAAMGQFVFPGEAFLVASYLSLGALTLLVARHAQSVAPGRLIDAMLNGVAIAAVASVGLCLCQWFQIDAYAPFVAAQIVDGRMVANLGHPNNLATLLAWGLVAIWWAHLRARVGAVVGALAAGFVLVGLALTLSRTGWLLVGLIALVALRAHGRWAGAPTRSVILGLSAWFMMLLIVVGPLRELVAPAAPVLSSEPRLSAAGDRPMIWLLALHEIANSPWIGYGWNQIVPAQVRMAAELPGLGTTVGHAHNVLLDLLLWNGVPLGMVMIAGLGWWFRKQIKAPRTPERVLILLALAVFAIHAMLELPHAYLFFLLPVAVMMGTLASPGHGWTDPIARSVVGALVAVYSVLLSVVFIDYVRIQEDLWVHRMRAVKIRNLTPPPTIRVLTGLQGALISLRIPPRDGMTVTELDTLRSTLHRYPTSDGLLRYAMAAARNGRPHDALWAMELLCKLHSASVCAASLDRWNAAAEESAAMAKLSARIAAIFPDKALVPSK